MSRFFAPLILVLFPGFHSCSSGDDAKPPIVGGGEIAKGFEIRFDKAESKRESIRLATTEKGFMAQGGPNAIYWNPANKTSGRYSLSVEVQHLDSHLHPHGAGLVFGGAKLADPAQVYTYFLVRGDGKFLIKKRDGENTAEITSWSDNDAVKPEDDKGVAKNKLGVEVGEKETRFLVNGVEVHRAANEKIHTQGLYGFRVIHDLKIQFVGLSCEALK